MAKAATAPRARVIMEMVALVAPPVPDEDAAAAPEVGEASEISAVPVRMWGW